MRRLITFPQEPLDLLVADPAGPLVRYLFWLEPVDAPARPVAPPD